MRVAPRTRADASTELLHREHGFTLIELLITMTLMLVIAGATMAALVSATAAQSRDQAYGNEVTATQTALARLTHDLRAASSITQVSPSVIQFQTLIGATTYNVRYDCSAPDTLGGSYHRCARTSAPASSALPAYGTTPGPQDIQHVTNGASSTFCTADGSAQAGVFMLETPAVANTSGLTCDEAHQTILSNQLTLTPPTYVQVMVKVPASGDLVRGGLTHQTVLQSGAFLPNLDSGA